ncbi:CaiB/BaiF CoA transferase family protein [Mesorhizobium sp. L-8-10]|uniref:CaiB/BaiF CoA transferase family protein n=1 Tax=Mesorhizobium sp. L-8-10 TaxID=2744523 RepID=UPI001927364A|nr:CoA transferase [Mesorhizobium sp. L-8-10]
MSSRTAGSRLLEGLVVVEIGTRLAATACGSLMADLGAEVVLVEDKAGPRPERALAAAGKRSLFVDSRDAGDRVVLFRLVDAADVVLLSSDANALDSEIWSRARPERQILCDLTAYGHSGPLAGTAHSEALVQAMAAIADTTGRPDGLPTFTGAPFIDMETAVYGLAAIMAATLVRLRTGIGQRIDMALYDVGVNALLTFIPLVLVDRHATRAGNRHPALATWNAFRALDGWVLICGPTNVQWRKLCTVMDRPALVDAPAFRTPSARVDNVDLLDAHVGAWVAGLTAVRCIELVSAQGIPCGPILPLDAIATEPNLVHRRMVLEASDPLTGLKLRIPGNPIRATGADVPVAKPVPMPDADRSWCLERAGTDTGAVKRVTGDVRLSGRPLEGVRIIEIGMNTVAPLACRQLGALGADVIKVEPPTGDTNRINAPLRADGEAYVYALSNSDKRGIVLDLKQPSDRETLWTLLGTADVVMENLKPGSLHKLGFGAQEVQQRYPSIVYCSVNGFGYDSVYPGRPALDTVIQGMSGAMAATQVDGVPMKAGISISDQLGGQFGLAGTLAALFARETGGTAVHLDIAMQDCSAWATQACWNGQAGAPPVIVAASDRLVAIEGDVSLVPSASTLSAAELVEKARGLGRAAAPILSVKDVMENPQTAARGLLKTVPTADNNEWLVLGSPLKLLSTPAEVRSAMPRLGFVHVELAHELGLPASKTPLTLRA